VALSYLFSFLLTYYCTYSPPMGQPGYLQRIIMAQAIS
jgi:hypothetical protein